jgi:Rod binding domain-containing protein
MDIKPTLAIPGVLEAAQDSLRPPKDTPEAIQESASQFEALLLAQILRQIRETGSGWMGSGEDQAGSRMLELAEEQLAQSMTKQGGLGLARMISDSLNPQLLNK